MTLANKILDFLSGSKRQKLIDNLHRLIEVEQRYLLEEFGMEYLGLELGVEEDLLVEILKSEYKVSFFQLLRQLRINHLKSLVSSYGEKLSLSDYVKFTGFRDVDMMLYGLKEETGLDFDDFCKYAQDVNNWGEIQDQKT
jgi:YesN/AraC family two-component response regulator